MCEPKQFQETRHMWAAGLHTPGLIVVTIIRSLCKLFVAMLPGILVRLKVRRAPKIESILLQIAS